MSREERYALTILDTPPSFNEYQKWHWSKQTKARQAWQEQVWGWLNQKGNRCPRGAAKVELWATIFFTVARRRDSDNFAMPLYKWTQDSLVHNKVIPDDTADICTSHPPKIAVLDHKSPMTIIDMVLTFEE